MLKKIGRILKSICTFLGAIVLLSWAVFAWFGWKNSTAEEVSEKTALVIDFNTNYSENNNQSILDELLQKETVSLQKLVQAIEIAAADDRVQALVAKLSTTDLEFAQIQDIARAVSHFRQSGKKTYVFSQGFGPLGQGNREYYLATFFEKIYMQPHTSIGLTGIGMEVPFVKDVLAKIGVQPEFYSRYEYKTAMMSLTDDKMSAEYREELQKLGSALWQELEHDIQNNRPLKEKPAAIRNRAPITAEEGKELGMIDELLYLPEAEQRIKEDGIENFADITDYAALLHPNEGDVPVVAWLNLNGIIDSGKTSEDIDGEYVVGSESVGADIAAIAEIDNLKAVVVRIDSPGGSYHAADEIYFALKKLKTDKKIPIVISQSGYAASGGYFISLAGDYILAEPTTITGSIGVLGGKVSLQELWHKLGVSWETVKVGDNADILSVNKPFSAAERKIFNASLDDVYRDFTAKVAENRKLRQDINKIARGRVWIGRQAVDLGLVDGLGGYGDALMKAKELAGLQPTDAISLVSYPLEKTFAEKIQDFLLNGNITADKLVMQKGGVVDIRHLKLFKRLQYDTVLAPFMIKM
ncbi:MAG: signal peptide peptidase SppA [Alphaproteobacteria bacterium]|nr:signal peptide peptidase SppA [Alphaproteobacteria bacterium]